MAWYVYIFLREEYVTRRWLLKSFTSTSSCHHQNNLWRNRDRKKFEDCYHYTRRVHNMQLGLTSLFNYRPYLNTAGTPRWVSRPGCTIPTGMFFETTSSPYLLCFLAPPYHHQHEQLQKTSSTYTVYAAITLWWCVPRPILISSSKYMYGIAVCRQQELFILCHEWKIRASKSNRQKL